MLNKAWRCLLVGVAAGVLVLCGFHASARGQNALLTRADIKRVFPGDTRRVWEQSRTLRLYSLDPHPVVSAGSSSTKRPMLHGFTVLEEVLVRDRATLRQVRDATDQIYTPRPGVWVPARCFSPRHAIRAQFGGKTVDLIICFGCGNGFVYVNDKPEKVAAIPVYSSEAVRLFNRILTSNGVRLAP